MKKFLLLTALSLGASSFVVFDAQGAVKVGVSAEDKSRQESLGRQVSALRRKIESINIPSASLEDPLQSFISNIQNKNWYKNPDSLTGQDLRDALKEIGADVAKLQNFRKASAKIGPDLKKSASMPETVNLQDVIAKLSVDKVIDTNSTYFNQNTAQLLALETLAKELKTAFSNLEFKAKSKITSAGLQTSLNRWLGRNKNVVEMALKSAETAIKDLRSNLKNAKKKFNGPNNTLNLETSPEDAKNMLKGLIEDAKRLKSQLETLEALKLNIQAAEEGQQAVKTALSDKEMFETLHKDLDTALVAVLKAANVGNIKLRNYFPAPKDGAAPRSHGEEARLNIDYEEVSLDPEDIAAILKGPMNIKMPKGLKPDQEKAFRDNLKQFIKVVRALNEKFNPKANLNDAAGVAKGGLVLGTPKPNDVAAASSARKPVQRNRSWFTR
jgi:hypothetical protein